MRSGRSERGRRPEACRVMSPSRRRQRPSDVPRDPARTTTASPARAATSSMGRRSARPVTAGEEVGRQTAHHEPPPADDVCQPGDGRCGEDDPRIVRQERPDRRRHAFPAVEPELDRQDVPDDHGHDGERQRSVAQSEEVAAHGDRREALEQVERQDERESAGTEQAPRVSRTGAAGADQPHVATGPPAHDVVSGAQRTQSIGEPMPRRSRALTAGTSCPARRRGRRRRLSGRTARGWAYASRCQ